MIFKRLILIALLIPAFAFAQEEGAEIDDTVDQDIFFDELPDSGIEFLDELPSDQDADVIYNQEGKRKRKNVDVIDKGPIELKQAPNRPPRDDIDVPDKVDPLFSVEKERPIEKSQPEQQQQQNADQAPGQDDFQFPATPGEGVPVIPSETSPDRPSVVTPGAPGTTPTSPEESAPFGRPVEKDSFGRPVKPDVGSQPPRPSPGSPDTPYVAPPLFEDLESPTDELIGEEPFQEEPSAPVATDRPTYDSTPAPVYNKEVEVIWNNKSTKEIKIQHPNAEKGLVRITQDRTYVYRVPRSKQDRAISFRFGMYEPENLENPETGASFQESYDGGDAPILFLEYEWHWLSGALGKFGLKVGSGIFAAEGNGSFATIHPENGSKSVPLENFTLVAFPNSVGAVYRMQFFDDQILVPYADGGLMAITFAEFRDDEDAPKLGLATAGFFSAGAAFNLGLLDKMSVLNLDREYGINSIYLTGEFRQIVNLSSDFDFESSTVSGGILMEF